METIIINTDGGARGNPGIAGAGAVIKNKEGGVLKSVSKPLGTKTNNEAEYEAALLGLLAAKDLLGKEKIKETNVHVQMDSELVCKQLNGEYQIKEENLFPYFIKIWNLRVKDIPHVSFSHVRREENAEADELANAAMDMQDSPKLL